MPRSARAVLAPLLIAAVAAAAADRAGSPAPPFDVAYRAWETVRDLARQNRQPELAGECGRTFQPFVVPALRRQPRQQQDAAAVACVQAARQACGNPQLQRTRETAARCEEFR